MKGICALIALFAAAVGLSQGASAATWSEVSRLGAQVHPGGVTTQSTAIALERLVHEAERTGVHDGDQTLAHLYFEHARVLRGNGRCEDAMVAYEKARIFGFPGNAQGKKVRNRAKFLEWRLSSCPPREGAVAFRQNVLEKLQSSPLLGGAPGQPSEIQQGEAQTVERPESPVRPIPSNSPANGGNVQVQIAVSGASVSAALDTLHKADARFLEYSLYRGVSGVSDWFFPEPAENQARHVGAILLSWLIFLHMSAFILSHVLRFLTGAPRLVASVVKGSASVKRGGEKRSVSRTSASVASYTSSKGPRSAACKSNKQSRSKWAQ